jgi:hypothetical protein
MTACLFAFVVLVGCGAGEDSDPLAPVDTGPPADTGTPVTELEPSVTWSAWYDQRLGASLTAGPGARLVIGGPATGGTAWEDIEEPTIFLIDSLIGDLRSGAFGRLEGSYYPGWGAGVRTLLGTEVLLPGDVTGDGEPDLVAFTAPGDPFLYEPAYLLPGPLQGSHHVMDADVLPVAGPDGWSGAYCGDLDHNGVDELCMSSGVVFGPVGHVPEPTLTWSGADAEGIRIAAADSDGDGVSELLLADPSSSSLHRLSALAPGDLDLATAAAATWSAPAGAPTAIVAGDDLDGDGAGDIVVAWGDGATARVYLLVDAAGGAFEGAATTLELPAAALTAGDFDGDRAVDLAVGGEATVRLFSGPLEPGVFEAGLAAVRLIGPQHPDDSYGAALQAIASSDGSHAYLVVGAPDVHDDSPYKPYGEVYLFNGSGLWPSPSDPGVTILRSRRATRWDR